MTRDHHAAVHLRRFANAVSIAMAVPRGQQGEAQTLRGMFELLGKSFQAARSGRQLSLMASSHAADPVLPARTYLSCRDVAIVDSPSASATIAAPEKGVAIPSAVIDQLSAMSNGSKAADFFAATPWSLHRSGGVSATTSPNKGVLKSATIETKDQTAAHYFSAIQWGHSSNSTVSIPSSPSVADSDKGRFGVLPKAGASEMPSQSVEFFSQVPWNRADK